MDGLLLLKQVSAVLAPLTGHDGTHIEVVVKPGGGKIVLGVDAVQIKVRQRARAAVVVDDGKRRA